jgi:hypothetical protein
VLSASPRLRRLVLGVSAAAAVAAGAVTLTSRGDGAAAPVQAEVLAHHATAPAPAVDLGTIRERAERRAPISRSARRVTLREKPDVVARKFMTAPLNLWPAPRERGRALAVLSRGDKVALTGVRTGAFAQILYGGQLRWVHRAYLADRMPQPKKQPTRPKTQPKARSVSQPKARSVSQPTPRARTRQGATAQHASHRQPRRQPRPAPTARSATGLSSAPCPDGSSTESGLTPSAVTLFRAVCSAFPALRTYGGYDAHGEHSSGKAIDFMVASSSLGQAVADWARAHATQLHLYDVIWAQHIWTPARASEGWRLMPDRGSPTANHYDHVHVSVS